MLAFQARRSTTPVGGGQSCTGLTLIGFDTSVENVVTQCAILDGIFSPLVFVFASGCPERFVLQSLWGGGQNWWWGGFPLAVHLKHAYTTHQCAVTDSNVIIPIDDAPRMCMLIWSVGDIVSIWRQHSILLSGFKSNSSCPCFYVSSSLQPRNGLPLFNVNDVAILKVTFTC